MNSKEKELFERALKGDGSILDDPNVDKIKNSNGWTHLHYLAYYSDSEKVQLKILEYPGVDKVKDGFGWTPLHYLAYYGTNTTKIKIAQKFGWDRLCKLLGKSKKQIMWELLK